MPAGRSDTSFAALSSLTCVSKAVAKRKGPRQTRRGDVRPLRPLPCEKRARTPGGSASFPGAWTAADKADEADGLPPINENNEIRRRSGPGKPWVPLSSDANFIGAYGFTQAIESVRNTSKKSNERHSR